MAPMKHPVDIFVGSKLKYYRVLSGLTQEGLAKQLNLTFQQVQKYENGANRISASRLYDIASILKVPIHSFFHGYRDEANAKSVKFDLTGNELMIDMSGSVQLLKHFRSIKDSSTKKALLALVKSLKNID